MRIATILLVLTFSLAAHAQGPTPFTEIHTQMALIGFTTATTQGDAGVLGMLDMCQADFPQSRMCTS